ncbi:MAG: P-type conjugative transfer ATPase TrbB [bacterium]|nr:P-type conjugative transfer ATPase TrbB [bacterium]
MTHLWTSEQTLRHRDSLRRELGETVLRALEDDDVTEVMLNADGQLWLDLRTRGMVPAGASMPPTQAASLLSTVAGLLNQVVSEAQPILEAELPLDGSRIEGILPPVVEAPVFAIRKRAAHLFPLAQYVSDGDLEAWQAQALRDALHKRRNLIVSGGPGSGKTTFVNAILHEMAEISAAGGERFVILEDTYELRCEAPNHVALHTSENVTLRALVRACLRLRPDRIVIGEVRGAEAHDLLKAWHTGNPGGCATVHANSALDALERLDHLAQEAGVPSQARLVASSVDLIVHMERLGSRRRARELLSVEGYEPASGYLVEPLSDPTSPKGMRHD